MLGVGFTPTVIGRNLSFEERFETPPIRLWRNQIAHEHDHPKKVQDLVKSFLNEC